ncbi:MAG: hypothetical protein OEN23_03150 [Paracoccaceae bacterium]|nr:hypothetical protein [Paracoccaceae bacterium]
MIDPAAVITRVLAANATGAPSGLNLAVALPISLLALLGALVLISPRLTQRFLRRRDSFPGRFAFGLAAVAAGALTLAPLPLMVRLLDPSSAYLANPLGIAAMVLAVAFFLLFIAPGSYARDLAIRADPQGSAAVEGLELANRTKGEFVTDVLGALTARMIAVIILIHPVMYIYSSVSGTAPSNPLVLVGALINAVVGLCFLIPSVTTRLFEPSPSAFNRFLFGAAAFFAVAITLGISGLAIIVPTSGDMREALTDGLGLLFQLPLLLFVILFLVPGHYTKRLARRARLREQATAEGDYTRLVELDEREEAGADWDKRLQAYRLQHAGAAVAASEPAEPLDGAAHPILLRLMFGLGVTVIAGVGFLSFYGWRIAQFVPTAELAALAPDLRVPMLIAMAAMGGLCAIATGTRRQGVIQSVWIRFPVMVAVALGLGAVGSQVFLTKGLPGALSLLSAGPADQTTVTVSGIGRDRVRRGCDYTLFARGLDYIGPKSVMLCEVGERVFRSVRVGDTITLHGFKTPYGFRYDRVTR